MRTEIIIGRQRLRQLKTGKYGSETITDKIGLPIERTMHGSYWTTFLQVHPSQRLHHPIRRRRPSFSVASTRTLSVPIFQRSSAEYVFPSRLKNTSCANFGRRRARPLLGRRRERWPTATLTPSPRISFFRAPAF